MLKTFIFAVLFFCGAAVFAQAPPPRQYNFTHLTMPSGLLSYQVNSILQDEEGYIWIATNEGLQRYDGTRFRNFLHNANDPSSIPSKSIYQIIKDKKKNLWLLTTDGKAGIFDTRTFSFRPASVRIKNTAFIQSHLLLKELVADEYGNIFLLLPGKELATYNEGKNEFSSGYNFIPLQKDWDVYDIVQQPGTKKYWLCLGENGLAAYDPENKKLSFAGSNAGNEPLIEHFKSRIKPGKIFFDSKQRVWFSGMSDVYPHLYCYDLEKQQDVIANYDFSVSPSLTRSADQFRTILEQKDGSIWVSGVRVLAKFLEKEKQFEQVLNGYVDDRSIDYVYISCLAEDSEHNLWACTGNNGIFRFNPSEEFFTNVKHKNPSTGKYSDGSPVSFLEDSDGTFLAGIWNESMLRYDSNLKEVPLGISGLPAGKATTIISMCNSSRQNAAWLAAADGIYSYDRKKRQVRFHDASFLKTRIRQVAEDMDGNLWIATQDSGVYKVMVAADGGFSQKDFLHAAGIPSIKANKVLPCKNGEMWIGTSSEGAYIINSKTFEVIKHFHQKAEDSHKLAEQTVSGIMEYDDSLVVISGSTYVYLYNRNKDELSTIATNATTSGFTSSLEKDSNGFVWLSTTTGLYRISIRSRLMIKFNREDGIRNDYFIIGASSVLKDGRMLMGTSGTMLVFNPADIRVHEKPVIRVTDFKVMNRSLRLDSLLQLPAIELSAKENSIEVDVSSFTYKSAYTIIHKLEGLDKEWKTADNNQIIYPYLPAGKYKLLVRIKDSEIVSGTNPLVLSINVNPPFYKRWWFLSLVALLFVAVLFLTDKQRMKRKEAIYRMRSDIAGNLHQDVNTVLGNINVLSEMARLKADSDPKKSKEFIEQIQAKSGSMMNTMEDMLWAISPENDSMQKVMERLKQQTDALGNAHSVQVNMLVDENVQSLNLDMKRRQDMYWFLKSGITNIIRNGAQNIRMHIGLEKSLLVYTLEFDSSSMDMQQFSNLLQRQELENKLKEVKGKIFFSNTGGHSVVELKVPV